MVSPPDRGRHNTSAKQQVSQTYENHFQECLVGDGDAVSSLESSGISSDQESSTKRRRLDPIFQGLPSDEPSVRERSTETTYGEGVSDGVGQKRQHAVQERQNLKRPREQLRQIEQTNPKIRFVIENKEAMGKLDYYPEVPFPSHEVRDTTLAGFFELYSKHSDIDLAHLHMLVFKVCFSKDEVLKVRRWECEDSWKTVKGRLSYLFREARREKPTKYDFDVAVYANEPNIQVAQIEEDNYDGL
ncbi:hypothetical protein B0O99DRAFT_592761 [Bisporella sp. PMI_857]|nr:hypothetical protein B0O99DRAFT_592761 [Bisporella sp. PMI_857]